LVGISFEADKKPENGVGPLQIYKDVEENIESLDNKSGAILPLNEGMPEGGEHTSQS
jgi:hypothetical protein